MKPAAALGADHQAVLARLGRLALDATDLGELLNQTAALVAKTLRADFCKIMELLPDRKSFLLRAGVGWKEGLVGTAILPVNRETHAGHALVSQRPVVIENVASDSRFRKSELLRSHAVVSGAHVVIPGAEPFGVLAVHTAEKRSFSRAEVAFLEAVAEILGQAIQRHRSHEAIRLSEERFRRTFDDAPIGIAIIGSDQRLLQVNRLLCERFGYSDEQLRGFSFPQLFQPGDSEMARTSLADLFAEKIAHFRHSMSGIDAGGGSLWLDVTVSMVRDEAGKPFHAVAMIQDITAQRRRERDLRLARFTLDRAKEAVYWVGPEGKVLDANASLGGLLGYSGQELLGLKVSDIDPSISAEAWPEFWRQVKTAGSAIWETVFRAKDGRAIPMEVTASYLGFDGSEYECVIARDITQRKLAEEQRRAGEEWFRSSFEYAGVGTAIASLDGRWLRVNQALCQFLGYSEEELAERSWRDVTHPDDVELSAEGRARLLAGEIPAFEVEKRYVHKSGKIVWGRLTVSLIRDAAGRPHSFTVQISDITKRKEAEEAFRRTEAALRRSEAELRGLAARLLADEEEKHRRLARDLHDDFSQRLAVVAFELARLEKECASGAQESLRECLRTLRARIDALSDDLRSVARQLHPAVIEVLGLPAALQELCESACRPPHRVVRFSARRLRAAIAPDVALALYRVAQEALRNIVRHSQASRVAVTLGQRGDTLWLAIKDNGIGFDSSEAAKGGIGLISMKERVRLVNGTLTVESQPERGTRIVVRVPNHERAGNTGRQD